MKRYVAALLCALLLLSGCQREESPVPEGAYQLYFAVGGEQAATQTLDFEYSAPLTGEDTATALVKRLLAGPETAGLANPFLPGVRVNRCSLEEDGVLHVDLSEQYNGLPGVYLTVANSCLVLTLSQLSGVEAVYITVEGRPLPYQTIQPLRVSDLVLSSAEEESVSVSAVLYFPREKSGALGVEYRTVVKTEKENLAAAVLAALLAGPEGEGLTPCLPAGTTIRSVKAENGLCRVDLSREFRDGAPGDEAAARAALYAVVNTLCATDELHIDAVQFYVEGALLQTYGGLPAAAPLEPDFQLTIKP